MERGNRAQRRLDAWVGIPLIGVAGLGARLRRWFPSQAFVAGNARKVGVLCLGAIGDMLLATALLVGLRRVLPDASIEIITSKANAVARDLLPGGFANATFDIRDIPGIVRHVRAARYGILLDTGQWARISALISALSGARRTVGFETAGQFRHYAYDRAVAHRDDRHEIANFLALGQALFPELEGTPEILVPDAPSAACPPLPENGLVFCHMWPSGLKAYLKEWTKEFWGELAAGLLAAGYTPVFTGGLRDAPATEAFIAEYTAPASEGSPPAISVAGRISFPDLAYHMRQSAAVVSVNTGTMHLAALAGAPTIGLHGPTNPARWGPVGLKTQSLLPETGRSAYLNLGFEYPPDAESVLRNLPVSAVFDALRAFGLTV